jgi:inward rectifier potassium channel
MSVRKHGPSTKANNDTGFGANTHSNGGRFVNRDGSFNLRKQGGPFFERISVFHTLLNLSSWKFFTIIILFFICVNLLYTAVYFLIGTQQFTGMLSHTRWQEFKELYFFSTETFTTVGYGRVNPIGDGANFVASLESLNGFLSLAIFTGLIYGRFSKPRAYLAFSNNALIAPFQGKTGLMFRFVSYKQNHTLTDVEVHVTLAMLIQEDNKAVYKFYDLPLERSKVQNLPMNWTVVHPIDETSPLAGLSEQDIKECDLELYVVVKGFDDVFSNLVQKRTSYTHDEIRFNHKFVPMYYETPSTTILQLNKLDEFAPIAQSGS